MAFKVNEYFDGNVKSISFEGKNGRATIGVMGPGAYEFSTTTIEVMTVIDGALAARLSGQKTPTVYRAGDSFRVGAGETFDLTVAVPSAYHCQYLT